ncbi:AI-2E family transporter [Geminicoccaceae bacterium 1502E]|nr:AI-2E family transporter [Geminicoccaceae bacterium 1502E]
MSRRQVSLLVVAAVLALLLVLAPRVLLVVFAGVLLAVFLRGGGDAIARWTGTGKGWGLGLFTVLLAGLAVGIGVVAAPLLASQLDELWQEVPQAVRTIREWVESWAWGRWILDQVDPAQLMSKAGGGAAKTASTAITTTFGALGNMVLILFLGIYMAAEPRLYTRGIEALVAPSLRPRAAVFLGELRETLQQWLVAQLFSMTIVGTLTGLGLWLLGVPLALVLGIIAALFTFIPNIGPVLSAVPALLLALAEEPVLAVWVVALYLGVQTLESYFITPLIQERRVELPPALVISVQLLLGVLFGVLGLALATPLAAAGLTTVRRLYVDTYLESAEECQAARQQAAG